MHEDDMVHSKPNIESAHRRLNASSYNSPEDVLNASSLLEKGIHHGSSRRYHRCLEKVAEYREYGME